jgi:hypothetical protein
MDEDLHISLNYETLIRKHREKQSLRDIVSQWFLGYHTKQPTKEKLD